jgi:hypothetical protein
MKCTDYFKNNVVIKRPYINVEWCIKAKTEYSHKETEESGRIKYWIYINEYQKYLRVIYLEDNETIHNAFFDRDFNKKYKP